MLLTYLIYRFNILLSLKEGKKVGDYMISLKLKKECPEIEKRLENIGVQQFLGDDYYSSFNADGYIAFNGEQYTIIVTSRVIRGQCLIPLKLVYGFSEIQILRPDGIRVRFVGDIRIKNRNGARGEPWIECYENDKSKQLICAFKVADFDKIWRF